MRLIAPTSLTLAALTALLPALSPACASASETKPSDAERPRMVISDARYQTVAARVSPSKAELQRMIASAPAYSVEVAAVTTGSRGEALGINFGDRWTEFDGVPMHDAMGWVVNRNFRAGTVTVYTSAGTHPFPIPEGRLGIGLDDAINPVALLSGREDGPGSGFLVHACLALRQDPSFSESALARAAEAGCTDPLLDGLFGIICANTGRQDVALAACDRAMAALAPAQRTLFAREAMVAAISCVNVAAARKLLAAYPDLFWETNQPQAELAALDAAVHPGDLPGKLPSIAAAALRSTSLLPEMLKQAAGDHCDPERALASGRLDFSQLARERQDLGPTGKGGTLVAGKPLAWTFAAPFIDGVVSGNLHLTAGAVVIALRDEHQPSRQDLNVQVYTSGMVRICPDGFPTLLMFPGIDISGGDNLFELRMFDGWWECDLNHRPIAYGPRSNPQASVVPCLDLAVPGGDLTGFDVRRYEAKAAEAGKSDF